VDIQRRREKLARVITWLNECAGDTRPARTPAVPTASSDAYPQARQGVAIVGITAHMTTSERGTT
jgi:hypothetical protein